MVMVWPHPCRHFRQPETLDSLKKVFKYEVSTSQCTYCITVTKSSQLNSFRAVIVVYFENRMKYMKKLCAQNT